MNMNVAQNLGRVRERIEAACRRAGRRPDEVKLVAVSKTVSPERIREAFEAGVRDFGENRVQEAAAKRSALAELHVTWHLVGHLQSNKAKAARELFQWIHSLDSAKLAHKLHQAAGSSGERLPVLIEVNLGEESAKSGVGEDEVIPLAREVSRLETLELCGLMTLPPFFEDSERARPFFRRLRELAGRVDAERLPSVARLELSMGMTNDFEVAIEEGATIVRIGTAIFGPRE